MSDRVCVGLATGETCALSASMELITDKGPIQAENLCKLWREDFFEWVELPTLMGVKKPVEHEWEEPDTREIESRLTVHSDGIAYVAEEGTDG